LARSPNHGPTIEKRFDGNLARYADRVSKIKARAIPALDALSAEGRHFDIVYLDAESREMAHFRNLLARGHC
jgi:hypothetical protein